MNSLEELNIFCLSKDFENCLKILKDRLKHQNQVDIYDSLYFPFVKTISKEEKYYNIIIPGLEYFIKLLSLSLIYKKHLFPTVDETFEFSEEDLLFIKYSMYKQYTMRTFFGTMSQILDLNYKYLFYEDMKSTNLQRYNNIIFSHNRISCVYALLHNAGSLSFSTSANMLLNDNFGKAFLSFKLYNNKGGAHGGSFKNPSDFLDHDLGHYEMVIQSYDIFDFSKLIKFKKNLPNNCIQRHFLDVFAHTFIFEDNLPARDKSNINILDFYQMFYENPFKSHDRYDHIYIIKYFLEAYDLNERMKKEEFNIVKHLNDNFILLIKSLKQYSTNEGSRIYNFDFSYLNHLFLYNIEDIEKFKNTDKYYQTLDINNLMNEYYYSNITRIIDENSMKIYNIIKRYI